MTLATIRAPKLCHIPDLKGQACGELAIGRCTLDVNWCVCERHFGLCKNNGFAPLTWAQLRDRNTPIWSANGEASRFRAENEE